MRLQFQRLRAMLSAIQIGVISMKGNHSVSASARSRRLFHSLRSKILISFGLLFVVTISLVTLVRTFGVPFTTFRGSYGREQSQTVRALDLIADLKKERLTFWLEDKKADARILADTSLVESSVKRLSRILQKHQRLGTTPDRLKAGLAEQESYRDLMGHLQLVMGRYSAYHKIQVADAKTGLVLVSTDDGEVGTQIADTRALAKAGGSAEGIAIEVSKSPSPEKPYLIIHSAIADRSSTGEHSEITVAVLSIYMDTEEFGKPLLYAGEGLGQTGDIYLVKRDRRLLLVPKYSLADGALPKVLEHEIKSESARLAVEGHEGVVLEQDYRGVRALAAYRSIMVTPDVAWGMVVKRDEAEVFRAMWKGLAYSLIVGVGGMVVALVLTLLITNRVSGPLADLSRTALEVETGNLSARAQVKRTDEVGGLAVAFNSMIDRVENWHKELEDQVRSRTAELAQERERLSTTLRSIGDGVISTDTNGRVLSLNRAAEELTGWPEIQALGRPLVEVFHIINEKTREGFECPVRKVLQRGHIVGLASETVLISRNGTERVIAASGAPIQTSDGTIVGVVFVFKDVTERKRAGDALQASEAAYRTLSESIPGIVYRVHLAEPVRVEFLNHMLPLMTGFAEQELSVGEVCSLDPLILPEDRAQVITAVKKAFSGNAPFEMEYRIRHKDAETRHFREYGRPVIGVPGSPSHIDGVIFDVTERKRAEEAVLRSEQLLRGILVASPVGISLTQDQIIKWANDTWVKMFGFEHESEYLDQPSRILYPSEEYYVEVTEAVYADLAGERRGEAYAEFRRKDGSLFDGHLQVTYLDPRDPAKGTIAAITDISEKKLAKSALRESERRYRTLFDESLDAVFVVDIEGRVTDANQALLDMFGSTREELGSHSVLNAYADPADRARYRQEIDRRGFVKDYPLKLRKKDGREMDCLVSARVRRNKEGMIVGHRGFIRDVTAQKALERQLVQAQKMEAVGTLAGGMAHDFNNLLQVVLGYSELLLTDETTPTQVRSDLDRILRAAKSGADLVQRLLTFSRNTEIRPLPTRLNREIEQVRQLLSRTIPKIIEIQLNLAEDLVAINADRGQIEQVMVNLSVNARDAMPHGGKIVIETQNVILDEEYCSTHLGSKPGPHVLLSVSDTGYGMDKKTLEHIFEPFFTTKGPGEGTGLGLAMVYGIVKQHDGYIKCYSEPGAGTTFKIYFPALVWDKEDERVSADRPPQGGTETILLVDDEEFIRDLGKRIFRQAGYSVLTASNGKEALELYERKREKIALVILDLIMPEMEGMQCLREILRLDPEARVLVSSGYAMNGPAKQASGAGARGFIAKPYDVRRVLQTVRDVLDAP